MNNKALEFYTKSVNKTKKFFKENQSILEEWERMQNDVNDAESHVKLEARENQATYENKHFKVVYSPAWKKWYDVDYLFAKASAKTIKLIKENCLKQEVNKAVFEELVEKGEIPTELQQEAFREKPMTARITIKKIIKEND